MNNFFCSLENFGLIQVSGQDAARFLQGQTTCDINQVNAQQSQLGAFCNPQGRILANFRIYKFSEDFYLFLPREIISTVFNALQKYSVFFKCTMQDASDVWQKIGIWGNTLDIDLGKIFPEDFAKQNNAVIVLNQQILLRVAQQPARYIYLQNSAVTKNNLTGKINFVQQNEAAWKLADINAGVATIGLATTSLFTPHQINFPELGGVSFNKGCYTGQEIVARLHYLGKLKQHLQQIETATQHELLPGAELLANNEVVGQLVDGVIDANNIFHGLATVRDDALEKTITITNKPVKVKKQI